MDSWSAFQNEVECVIEKLSKEGCDVPYFRGHGDTAWSLTPSLGRKKYSPKIEKILYYDFLTHAGPLISSPHTPWDVLFSMRHHSLPTRLLDWSESFSVALYFAIKDFKNHAAVWILDPFELNREAYGAAGIPLPDNDWNYNYFDYFIAESARFGPQVVAIRPTKTYLRVIAQRAGFTLHQNLNQGLESLYPKHVSKVELTKEALPSALRFLKLAGTTEYALFPDLDGLARWLYEIHDL